MASIPDITGTEKWIVQTTLKERYRCQFFYKPYKQMGTGVSEYDDLGECVVALLQTQADFAAEQKGDLSAS